VTDAHSHLVVRGVASAAAQGHRQQPLLVFGTVASAVMVHRGPWLSKPLFLALACLGSLATLHGTLGRTSSASDLDHSQRENRLLALAEAREGAKKECGKAGDRCKYWQARIDALTQQGSATVDPRGEAIARLATLVCPMVASSHTCSAGLEGGRVKQLSQAVEPVLLPLFLELGSVLFFTVAFPSKRKAESSKETETVAQQLQPVAPISEETVSTEFNRDMALRDFRQLKDAGSQRFLSERWGVDKSTVSRWLKDWETEGLVQRHRNGKEKPVLALPSPSM
jgi:hypothetical protein